ncbi:hypothetical protein MSNKSG1_01863 [Marinobacter santoriniensis NKSG1]|uniref:DUF4123 domain-containing protein n=1 Tax=Marinobacter santoriniensis NKSG1 TaxID=1288826 RepID=M7DI16_9GAMM|nr:DUF4123 domain-containing protein [Marinobacter santoriniensis]EMP57327.1 hypothetical protein MSNKSG1_01863 [Marinobacter santoriniensis NKSG1]
MSMDAADCINTLEHVAPPVSLPDAADFAIVDLAADEQSLQCIYDAMIGESIHWLSLFQNTPWFPQWKQGPVLLDLRQAPVFRNALIERMVTVPSGLLVRTNWSMDEFHAHISHCIHDGVPMDGHLLRLHEPRWFGPLLCAVGDRQRQAILAAGTHWFWYDSHTWRTAMPDPHDPAPGERPLPRLSLDRLEATTPYWLAAEARGYRAHYESVLPQDVSATAWILTRLQEAHEAGFRQSDYLERWLRLAIRQGAGFHRRSPYSVFLEDESKTPGYRLSAMEGAMENANATL